MAKIFCLIILIIALISVRATPTIINPLFDEDPSSAPPFNEPLDVSNLLNFRADGQQINVYDLYPSYKINQIPSSYFLPAINIIDKLRQLVYYRIGNVNNNGYIYWVNASVNYQIFTGPNYYMCFLVPNYTYSKNLFELEFMRRVGSARLTAYANSVQLKNQIDAIYGTRNKICRSSPDADIIDIYYGIMNDGSSCGGDCGDQRGGVVIEFHTSRYAKVCYNQTFIVDEKINQYYPSNPADTLRNFNTALYIFDKFSRAKNSDINTFQTEVNTACAVTFSYSDFYNAACPFPDQAFFPCGSSVFSANSTSKINPSFLTKLNKYYNPEQVKSIKERFGF